MLKTQFNEEQKRLESSIINLKKHHVQQVISKLNKPKMDEQHEKQLIEREQWQEMYMKKVEADIQKREVFNLII